MFARRSSSRTSPETSGSSGSTYSRSLASPSTSSTSATSRSVDVRDHGKLVRRVGRRPRRRDPPGPRRGRRRSCRGAPRRRRARGPRRRTMSMSCARAGTSTSSGSSSRSSSSSTSMSATSSKPISRSASTASTGSDPRSPTELLVGRVVDRRRVEVVLGRAHVNKCTQIPHNGPVNGHRPGPGHRTLAPSPTPIRSARRRSLPTLRGPSDQLTSVAPWAADRARARPRPPPSDARAAASAIDWACTRSRTFAPSRPMPDIVAARGPPPRRSTTPRPDRDRDQVDPRRRPHWVRHPAPPRRRRHRSPHSSDCRRATPLPKERRSTRGITRRRWRGSARPIRRRHRRRGSSPARPWRRGPARRSIELPCGW